jgi:hypothetical protein
MVHLERCQRRAILNNKKNNVLHAIVVMPPALAGRIQDKRLRRWLSKGRLSQPAPEDKLLYRVADLMGHDAREDGLAALHFWGQTGERSASWMAATDPVHLEARLDHLYLHDLRGEIMPMSDLRPIFDFLQATFGSDNIAFARIGHQGYLRGEQELATASVSARDIDGLRPDEFMPKQGIDRNADDHHRLLSEIQMALFEHEVNINRMAAGRPEVNSLWIWGGGRAPEAQAKPIYPLFGTDPLFKGFWLSRTGIVEGWSGNFDACIELAVKGFVAITPDLAASETESVDHYLQQLKDLLSAGKIGRLTLLFRDGLYAEMTAIDAYRFWRRESPLLMPQRGPQ